ncbi:MAG: hypothetical protein WC156_00770 [Pedobacter sp.]
MFNLLFISNSPKMAFIKNNLQTMSKVKIDVVTDFDRGLKDVFEKRPATIIIQDQISGVTGESVARHIQMLLGSGAPVFVLMHEGKTRIKPIKGLFEHIVDLTQPDTKLFEDIQAILKTILGPEWEKNVIAPKQNASSVVTSFAMPDDNSADVHRLVDDFIFDLENTDKSSQEETLQPSFLHMDQPEEELFEFEYAADSPFEGLVTNLAATEELFKFEYSADSQSINQIEPKVPVVLLKPKQKDTIPGPAPPPKQKTPSQEIFAETSLVEEMSVAPVDVVIAPETEPGKAEQHDLVEPKITIHNTLTPDTADVTSQVDGGELNPVQPSPAECRITPASQEIHEQIPEDLLQAFGENYHSQASTWKRLAIVVIVVIGLGAGGWALIKQKPILLSFKTKMPTSPPVSTPIKSKEVAAIPVGKPVGATTLPLPSFIPTTRRDVLFTTKNPGWERYVGKMYEYRVFRSGDKVKVVQVLAGIGTQTVDNKFFTTVLKEFIGNVDYSISSQEQKQGYLVQRGSVGQKADLLVYRLKKTGRIRAFVVALN